MPAPIRMSAIKSKVSARAIPKNPDREKITQSETGFDGNISTPANNRVGMKSARVTVVFSRFSAIGERLSPLFLKRMTAMAHKQAAVIENVIPTICMDPVVTLSSLAESF